MTATGKVFSAEVSRAIMLLMAVELKADDAPNFAEGGALTGADIWGVMPGEPQTDTNQFTWTTAVEYAVKGLNRRDRIEALSQAGIEVLAEFR